MIRGSKLSGLSLLLELGISLGVSFWKRPYLVSMNIDQHLDASGLNCPLPLLKAKQALNKMAEGECLRVVATDAGSVRDFKSFAELSGHHLLESIQQGDQYIYVLQKHTAS